MLFVVMLFKNMSILLILHNNNKKGDPMQDNIGVYTYIVRGYTPIQSGGIPPGLIGVYPPDYIGVYTYIVLHWVPFFVIIM